jgi:uncharacterized protein
VTQPRGCLRLIVLDQVTLRFCFPSGMPGPYIGYVFQARCLGAGALCSLQENRKVRTMSLNHVEIVRGGYGDFAKGNIPGVLAVFDPKIEWTETEGLPYGGIYIGPSEVVEKVFMRLGAEWDGFKVTPKEFLEAGERVIVLGQSSGTFKGTGKSFRSDFVHVWTVRSGKVVKFVQYVDTALVQKAVQP